MYYSLQISEGNKNQRDCNRHWQIQPDQVSEFIIHINYLRWANYSFRRIPLRGTTGGRKLRKSADLNIILRITLASSGF